MISKTRSPAIIEIVGLAGAGKSTLSLDLRREFQPLVTGERLQLKTIRRLPFLLQYSYTTIPFIWHQLGWTKKLTLQDFKDIFYVITWHKILIEQRIQANSNVMLDQGPVFKLACLREFGPVELTSACYESWWDGLFRVWADTLDLIIWLDAPKELLLNRIVERKKNHYLKGKNLREADGYFNRYQAGFDFVVSRLIDLHKIPVLRLNTVVYSREQCINKILQALDEI